MFAQYELSKKIIIDWDFKFILNFWQTLITILEIKYKSSTVYHKKIDKQSKILNQIIKQYLKYYISYQ